MKIEVLDIFKSDDGDAFWPHRIFVTETSHIGKSAQKLSGECQLSNSTMSAKNTTELACKNPRVKQLIFFDHSYAVR